MNNITLELCAEDRARLDKLAKLIEEFLPPTVELSPDMLFTPVANGALIDAPKMPQEAPKAEPEKTIEPEEKAAPAPKAEEKPSITLDQIQQKVVQLAAGFGGSKKARVRAIISAYGTKVSDLKGQPEKWAEVWAQLLALEKEA